MSPNKLADWIGEHLSQAHRGAFVERKKLIIFGNDGVGDPHVIHELELVLRWLRENVAVVFAFRNFVNPPNFGCNGRNVQKEPEQLPDLLYRRFC
jgi:hypothetical protein